MDEVLKTCKLCKKQFPRDHFYYLPKEGKKWDCRDSYCKPCRSKYANKRRKGIKKLAVEYLGGKCFDCGIVDKCLDIYDFHHKDPDGKDFSISKKNQCFESIKSELDKCVLVCANCHRRRHSKV